MIIEFLKTKDKVLAAGEIMISLNEPCPYNIIETRRGKMIKVAMKLDADMRTILAKEFEMSFTNEYAYIPQKYIKTIKEGVSIEEGACSFV